MSQPQKKKVALLGGSFNPPTKAHLEIAKKISTSCDDISEVWLIPCGDGRSDKKVITHSSHRLKMLELICKDMEAKDYNISICTKEIELGKYIPTYFLLKDLQNDHKDIEFLFVIGADLLQGLKTWDEPERLLSEFTFLIVSRDGFDITFTNEECMYPKKYQILKLSEKGSSTDIRDYFGNEEKRKKPCLLDLTTDSVKKYIIDNNLYLDK